MTRSAPTAAVLLVFALTTTGFADDRTVQVSNREQLVKALATATPGTTIAVAPGTYRGGLSRVGLRGTAERPIVLAASDPANPPVIDGGTNGLQLSDPEFVELRHLIFTGATGNGLNIDDGGSVETPARHVKLIGLTIRDVGPQGNRDGIKLSGLDDFVIEGCTLERWGDAGSGIDMVGCRRGSIRGCTFRFNNEVRANGVQTKGGTRDIAISRCRFENAGSRAINCGGSTGLAYFRPKVEGFEAKDITIEDCTFLGSPAAIAFVGVDGAIVRHNTIYRPRHNAIRILQETRGPDFVPCRNVRFENNLIVFRRDELRTMVNIGPDTAPETFTFTGNAWHCLDRPDATKNLVRLPTAETNATYHVAPQFVNAEQGDLRILAPKPATFGARE